MLKLDFPMNETRLQSRAALEQLLSRVPIIEVDEVRVEQPAGERNIDLVMQIRTAGQPYRLLCEVLPNGQPRYVSHALLKLRDYQTNAAPDIVPILIAPYFSPGTRAICQQSNVGYLDLEGNASISFGGVFIDRQVAEHPAAERRELRSLFKPKSAQVLRAMLREPRRTWRVAELANATGVSLGHVSNVRAGLLDREWAETGRDGLYLTQPDALLDAWRDSYDAPAGERKLFYTALHGSALEHAARNALGAHDTTTHYATFASFSAAAWIAPYGRTATQYFYATAAGLDALKAALNLTPVSKGENVVITLPKDDGLLRDTIEPAPGAICTSLVQTYLDLALAGERGMEAARHLREERMRWQA
ncbi:conserved protein of unknown function [Burkholderia multivorans]